MRIKNLNELTPSEYYYSFLDKLNSLVNRAFDKGEALMFVTYQPNDSEVDYNKVTAVTKELFNRFKYIEVLERTFRTRKLYGDGNYENGYHSHILMLEKDYLNIKKELKGLDIVAKVVYNIAGLMQYLTKQTVNGFIRLLPTTNMPPVQVEEPLIRTVRKSLFARVLSVVAKVVKKKFNSIKRMVFNPLRKLVKTMTEIISTREKRPGGIT